ncbi:pilus assembly protein N-terminal domain-containing protein [Hansschlegelia sp.]|uniref:pilus assembly protein N-terminal domain-containing protein n=1 Tax=Hansschlegelia sp. TaxID=2041892 RepID=UPI002BD28A2C|nr:pilus assembly protein N-terminal domain-containing protein [Hansschlegelia sp.]HVI29418.1 pilus assembly protein N-terminal domain-containing protein [Hansschlegelia sp.]
MTSSLAVMLRIGGLFGALSVGVLSQPALAAQDTLSVAVDRASIMRAPEGTATVIIGNPLIADATTQRNGVLVVTGKSFGSTNIMLLDGGGAVLSETIVNVGRPADGTLVVQKGGKRESFACNPRCEPVLSIGDNAEAFSATATQITQRNGMSSGSRSE